MMWFGLVWCLHVWISWNLGLLGKGSEGKSRFLGSVTFSLDRKRRRGSKFFLLFGGVYMLIAVLFRLFRFEEGWSGLFLFV